MTRMDPLEVAAWIVGGLLMAASVIYTILYS